jgi:hypothetical protein
MILYVDDLLLMGNHAKKFAFVEAQLESQFKMSKLEIMHAYIGVQFLYLSSSIVMCQQFYAQYILARFGMMDHNPSSTPTDEGIRFQAYMKSEFIN